MLGAPQTERSLREMIQPGESPGTQATNGAPAGFESRDGHATPTDEGTQIMTTATQPQAEAATEAEISQVNSMLIDLVVKSDNDSDLNRGLSWVVRNRILIALAQPQGLEVLTMGTGDTVMDVRARIRAAGEWLIQVAKEAQ